MKTPEEIKTLKESLRLPTAFAYQTATQRMALEYIEQLEHEKKALIYDIRNYGFHLCFTCAYHTGKYDCAKLGTNGLDRADDGEIVIMRCGQYEWRGITEGKDGNVHQTSEEEKDENT